MSIRYKFLLAFSLLVAMACSLALFGFRGVAASGDLVVRLYDGPLMGINHARSAHAALNEARLLMHSGLDNGDRGETIAKFVTLLANINEDLKIVRERVIDGDVVAALERAEHRIGEWADAALKPLNPPPEGLTMVPTTFSIARKSKDAASALDDLVETVAAYGFGYRMEAEAKVAAARTTMLTFAAGTVLIGLMFASSFAFSMIRPILKAVRIAESVAAGAFDNQIENGRRDEFGRLLGSLAVMQTSLKTRARENLAVTAKLNAALDNMTQGLCMFGADDRLLLWNQRFLEMYRIAAERIFAGCKLEHILEAQLLAGTACRDPRNFVTRSQSAAIDGSPDNFIAEILDGRTISISNQPIDNGGWVSTHEDITERKKNEAHIAYLALNDPLTELPNRAAFNEHVAKLFRRASAKHDVFSILCIDLDRFKDVNNEYGHVVGDQFLCEVARRLELVCNDAFLARLGGDEFAIVSPGAEQPTSIQNICAKLSALLEAPICVNGSNIRGSLTVGVSSYPEDGSDADTLIACAEAALYRAQAEEYGTIRFFDASIDKQTRERRLLQQDLALALENDELRVYYQPQASSDGNLVGFEALVRWKHPVRGMVSPGQFIPLAEEAGLVRSIDEWVLREACREAATWSIPLSIAVNLSPVNFKSGDVSATVLGVLVETGLHPGRLEIEITEGVLIDDFDRAVSLLRKIKNLGVRVAMDDFGTGYSSLSYLQSFPFDKIKIDQTFIASLGRNIQSAPIIQAILSLGRSLKLPILAEGVETAEQLAFLADAGCDEIQGYLIGRPQPFSYYRHLVTQPVGEPDLLSAAG
jgi:diguanylate cyclase (GGDEF)-like protein